MTDEVKAEETVEVEEVAAAEGKKPKFGPDSGLGFMRAIQFGNVMTIFLNLVAIFFVSGKHLTGLLAFSAFDTAINIICMGEVIWLIAHRKMYTRQIAIVMYAITAINAVVLTTISNGFSWEGLLTAIFLPCLLSLYFATSRRAKAVLVQPFDVRLRDKGLADGENKVMWNPRSKEFWMRLLIYFFLFSVAGHWMEMGLQIAIINGLFPGTLATADSLTWRDSLNPFFIYGFAVAFCGLALYPLYIKLKEKMPKIWMAYVVSFLINGGFCVLAELALGLAVNADHHAWDYSDQFLNFQGQICFVYSISFAIVSSAITWFLYPAMERQFSYISKEFFRVLFVGSAVLFLFLVVAYNIDPVDMGIMDKDLLDTSAEMAASSSSSAA